MENKIFLTIEEGMGTDGQFFSKAVVCGSAQEAGEYACSLMANMAEKMDVYTVDFDPTATWEIEGDGWWYRVYYVDSGADPHWPSPYLLQTAKKLNLMSEDGLVGEENQAFFIEQATAFVRQFMEEYLLEDLRRDRLQIIPNNMLQKRLGQTSTLICNCGHRNDNVVIYPYGYDNEDKVVAYVAKCEKCNSLMFTRD